MDVKAVELEELIEDQAREMRFKNVQPPERGTVPLEKVEYHLANAGFAQRLPIRVLYDHGAKRTRRAGLARRRYECDTCRREGWRPHGNKNSKWADMCPEWKQRKRDAKRERHVPKPRKYADCETCKTQGRRPHGGPTPYAGWCEAFKIELRRKKREYQAKQASSPERRAYWRAIKRRQAQRAAGAKAKAARLAAGGTF